MMKLSAANFETNKRDMDKKLKYMSYSFNIAGKKNTEINVNLPSQWFVNGRATQNVRVNVSSIVSSDFDKNGVAVDAPYAARLTGLPRNSLSNSSLSGDFINYDFYALIRAKKSDFNGDHAYFEYYNAGTEFVNSFGLPQQMNLNLEFISCQTGTFDIPNTTNIFGTINFELEEAD